MKGVNSTMEEENTRSSKISQKELIYCNAQKYGI